MFRLTIKTKNNPDNYLVSEFEKGKDSLGSYINTRKKINNSFNILERLENDIQKLGAKISEADIKKWNIPIAEDYKKFLQYIEESRSELIPSTYLVILDKFEKQTAFFILKSCNFSSYHIEVIYKPENSKMEEFTKNLFKIEDGDNTAYLVSMMTNNFQFVTEPVVLNLLYTSEAIKERGEKLFRKFQIPKKSGGKRTIIAPHEDIKEHLRTLNHILQEIYDVKNFKFQIAYKKNRSIKNGAQLHTTDKYVMNVDLKDFFPSCKEDLVEPFVNFLYKDSYNKNFLKEKLTELIYMDGGLFIGSPISGTLANAVLSSVMSYMNAACQKMNINFSIYADDLSFSSNKWISSKFIKDFIQSVFEKYNLDEYFKLNEKKIYGGSGCHRKVTGVSINDSDKITVSRNYYRELRAAIANLSNQKGNVNLQKLRGKIAYATMLDDSGKIYKYLDKYSGTVEKYNLCSEETLERLKKRSGC